MRIYIVGGGSSVTPEVYDKLRGERAKGHKIFAVNNAYRYIECDYLVFLDRIHFDDAVGQPLPQFRAKHTLRFETEKQYRDLTCEIFSRFFCGGKERRVIPVDKFKKDMPIEQGVFCGGSYLLSGIAAISLSLQMGFDDVVLCGYDGGEINGKTHHHHVAQPEGLYSCANEKFNVFRGMPIRNTSLESKINIFTKVSLDEVINSV